MAERDQHVASGTEDQCFVLEPGYFVIYQSADDLDRRLTPNSED